MFIIMEKNVNYDCCESSATLLLNSNLHTGCPDRCGLRNGALTEMFLDFRGPQRLPWDPKDGRKLLLGKKHTFMC